MKNTRTSREEVKERLLRTAADAWGMPGIRTGQVDPVVDLLFGALALEIERVGHAIHDSDARVFERIAKYLLPEVFTLAEPAHAVAKLHPEKRLTATRYDEMTFERTVRRKENMNRPETHEYCFSVAGDVNLCGTRIVCRALADGIEVPNGTRWTPAAALPFAIGPQVMYLGLQGEFAENEVVRLYLDWPGQAARERCLMALSRITVHDTASTPLHTGVGLAQSEPDKGNIGRPEVSVLLEKWVRAFYNDRFLRIEAGQLTAPPPDGFIPAVQQAGVPDPATVRWIRLDFPSDISPQLIREAMVLDHCVPLVNRRLEKAIYRLQHEINIKRLDANGSFLGMEKAESNQGQVYAEVPSAEQVDNTAGSFTIRHGTTARFDERNGSELLQHAVDLVREESQAFASLDMATTVSDLRAIGQALSRIERRLQEAKAGKAHTYVAIRPFGRTETAHLHYWTTDGTTANGIPAGTHLRSKQQSLAARGPVQLVTATTGAREQRSQKELIQQYRAAVLSRGRIVTRRDIIEHCRMVCGMRLRTVTVEEGVMLSPHNAKGLVRCLDVVLVFDERSASTEEIGYFRERLHAELNAASALSLPLRLR